MKEWYENIDDYFADRLKEAVEEVEEELVTKVREIAERCKFPRDMKLPENDEDVVD